jgi:hypothetical protein
VFLFHIELLSELYELFKRMARAETRQQFACHLMPKNSCAWLCGGVLLLSMPKAQPGQPGAQVDLQLHAINATRGERVSHSGSEMGPVDQSSNEGD